ncbi:hypothetical protein [Sphingomonas sp. MS122]|uniref:hypothetical protein n=1 Tax=Sphingomonas sp. MS122 TaxID=3412683 RepID=UPI003C2CA269
MIPAAASAVLIALAGQATAVRFDPPLDKPLRVVTEAVRTDSGVTRRFVNARRVVFRRVDAQLKAEVTIEGSEPIGPSDDPAAMARAGFAHIAGRTIMFQLDAGGRVVVVEDHAVVWRAMLDGFAAQAPVGTDALDRKRAGRVRAIVGALAAMSADRQRETLASLIEPLIAADTVGGEAPRPVRVPAASPYGKAELEGIRASRMVRGRLELSITAQGDIAVQGADGAARARVTLETQRVIDPATGLVLDSREKVRTLAPDGSMASERESVSRLEH